MITNDGIRVEEVRRCYLCQNVGTELYTGLRDRLFGAPGLWGFLRCPGCGLVWLNPRPLPEHLHKVYANYYTHVQEERMSRFRSLCEHTRLAVCAAVPGYSGVALGWGWRQLGKALCLLPPLREIASLGTMCLNGSRKGKLLDVGCGSGRFLALMRDAGWKVLGVEQDRAAAKLAQERFGVPVIVGTLPEANLPEESFDAVTLSHVIEHVYDPVGLLAECRRVLKPGGRVVVLSPNVESRGRQTFRESWLHLDPPRHLFLFSLMTLGLCAQRAGSSVDLIRTSARAAAWTWAASRAIGNRGALGHGELLWAPRILGLFFQAREEMDRYTRKDAGEELVLVGGRGPQG